jgi:surface antigen
MVSALKNCILVSIQLYLLGQLVFATESDLSNGLLWESQDMGIYNLTSCSNAPSCGKKLFCKIIDFIFVDYFFTGTTMATYNGVHAKSNGQYQCTGNSCSSHVDTGSQYQCVELAQRYMHQIHGIAANWWVNAQDMCGNHPSGISKTSNPQPGDLWVRTSGTYGHVAVITAVHSSTVDVIEQNSSPSGKNTYNKVDAGCFLTAGHAASGSCDHLGYYCGNDGLGKDANKLYYCSGEGATPSVSKDCSFTCAIMPKGQDDKCASGSCSSVVTGYYCGSDKIGGDKNTLYLCKDSKPAGAKYCANGCATAAKGSDDYCK